MGQAWCKEKSTKVQDSKSPLDRVFLRCAHRIYPSLKEEGSVLGGATQRVTSSEIGYASSPPREVLMRDQSEVSVDRPFRPSDRINVNVEVPIKSEASSAMTLDETVPAPIKTLSSLYSTETCSRDSAPVPPPRRKRENRKKPLLPPPRPVQPTSSPVDRVTTRSSKDSRNSSHEALDSTIEASKNRSSGKENLEHEINRTGRVIPVPASRSRRDKSSLESEKISEKKKPTPRSRRTTSASSDSRLKVANENSLGKEDGKIKIPKIIAAESLPTLLTIGAHENLMKSDSSMKEKKATRPDERDDEENKSSADDVTEDQENLNSIIELDEPRLTSTPVKNDTYNDSILPKIVGECFSHQDRAPESDNTPKDNDVDHRESEKPLADRQNDSQGDKFFETEKDQLDKSEDIRRKNEQDNVKLEDDITRTGLKGSLPNEEKLSDSSEDKSLRVGDSTTFVRSNSPVEHAVEAITKETLPREMSNNEMDFIRDEEPIESKEKYKSNDCAIKVMELMKNDDAKTSPARHRHQELMIKSRIHENDDSKYLKVLRDEAKDSDPSSVKSSPTELKDTLSEMLERNDEQEQSEVTSSKIAEENLSHEETFDNPVELNIHWINEDIKNSGGMVGLKNIFDGSDKSSNEEKSIEKSDEDRTVMDDLTNGDNPKEKEVAKDDVPDDYLPSGACPTVKLPLKPKRLRQKCHDESSKISSNVPPPIPRKRSNDNSLGRSTTPENPHSNDTLT